MVHRHSIATCCILSSCCFRGRGVLHNHGHNIGAKQRLDVWVSFMNGFLEQNELERAMSRAKRVGQGDEYVGMVSASVLPAASGVRECTPCGEDKRHLFFLMVSNGTRQQLVWKPLPAPVQNPLQKKKEEVSRESSPGNR